jgi:glycosyltransferase involved in cell wall biosynthesis
MSNLSALVVAHNEEAILDDCLAHLSFADEIVLVADRCTDETVAVAKRHNAKIIEGAWEIEGVRRSVGIEACSCLWILEVDADEWIETDLAEEIAIAVEKNQNDFFFTPIHNYVYSRYVRYGWMAALATDLKGSLFRKGAKTWGMERVHPNISFSGTRGPDLIGGVRHNFAKDISTLMQRFNRNTSLGAEDMASRKDDRRTKTMARKVLSRFWKCYVARKGYKEDGLGFIISFLSALYPLVAHLKAREINDRAETMPIPE